MATKRAKDELTAVLDADPATAYVLKQLRSGFIVKGDGADQGITKINKLITGLNLWGKLKAAEIVEEAETVETKKAQEAYDAALATKSEDGNDSSTSLGANDW